MLEVKQVIIEKEKETTLHKMIIEIHQVRHCHWITAEYSGCSRQWWFVLPANMQTAALMLLWVYKKAMSVRTDSCIDVAFTVKSAWVSLSVFIYPALLSASWALTQWKHTRSKSSAAFMLNVNSLSFRQLTSFPSSVRFYRHMIGTVICHLTVMWTAVFTCLTLNVCLVQEVILKSLGSLLELYASPISSLKTH